MVSMFLNIFVFQLNSLYQRICSIFLYTIPLKASIPYGYYLFYKYSFLKFLAYLTFPVVLIENSLPFGGLLLLKIIVILQKVENFQLISLGKLNKLKILKKNIYRKDSCLLYTSPSPRDY